MVKSYSIEEAAEFLHTSVSNLGEILKTGELMAAKHGVQWCILEEDLIAYHRKKCEEQMAEMRERGKVTTSFAAAQERRRNKQNPKPELPALDPAA